jgi:tRNA(Ile)-lysidine synthase
LLRGTGPRGLAGIPPIRDNLFIRPLIEISRNEIMSFLQQHQLAFRTDRSNLDTKYLRNRIRHELLPLIKKRFSTNCVDALNRLASILRTEETFWEPMVKNVLESQAIRLFDTEVVMPVSEMITLHPALSRRLVRDVIVRLTGTLKQIRHNHVESVLSLAHSAHPSGIVNLARGVRVIRDQDRLIFRLGEQPTIPPFKYQIEKPGTLFVPEIAAKLRLSVFSSEEIKGQIKKMPSTTALFDLKTISFPIIIRNFRHGDRFVPLGMTGSQKIKDFFINIKVPRSKRMACPLLLNKGEIIWVGGHRISEQVKITEDTDKVLRADLISLELCEPV